MHYSGKHMFGLGTVHATFTVREGELRVGEPWTTSRVTVTVDAASFSSNSARRDKDVRSAGLLDVNRVSGHHLRIRRSAEDREPLARGRCGDGSRSML